MSDVFAADKIKHRFVDKEVIGIIIGEDHEDKLFRIYGEGVSTQSGFARCYFNPTTQQYIVFELGEDKVLSGVAILDKKIEPQLEHCEAKSLNIDFLTGKKIKLGDPSEAIIQIYGYPEKRLQKKDGSIVFEYHTDSKHDSQVRLFYDSYLTFKNGTLVKISIHDGN